MLANYFPRNIVVGIAMVLAGWGALWLTPHVSASAVAVDLEKMIPRQFGDWQVVSEPLAQMSLAPGDGGNDLLNPYDQTLMRTYRNNAGDTIMLAIAYGKEQRQEKKMHRPELCYYGQGFRVEQTLQEPINIEGRSIPLTRLIAHNPSRVEPVSYWIRIGDRVTTSAMDTRLQILWQGLRGRVVDGALVRVSGVMNGSEAMKDQFAAQDGFIKSLAIASGDATRNLLLGDAGSLQ